MKELTLEKQTNVAASPGFATDVHVLRVVDLAGNEKKEKRFFASWTAKWWVRRKFGQVTWKAENGRETALAM